MTVLASPPGSTAIKAAPAYAEAIYWLVAAACLIYLARALVRHMKDGDGMGKRGSKA